MSLRANAVPTALLALLISASFTRAEIATSDVLNKIGFDQHLNAQIPLDLHFADEAGSDVELGDYFHDGKPVVLLLGYYGCPMLCSQILNDLAGSVRALTLKPGVDFEVVMVSVDPAEDPAIAAGRKKSYLDVAGAGWHFLTGKQTAIDALAHAAGFRYALISQGNIAHPSGLVVLTPQGIISRYLLGIDFPPRDLRLSLVEASQSRIGALSDQVLLLCYRYDPSTGKYGFAIIQVIRIAGVLTVAALAGFIFISLRRERRKRTPQTAS